MSTDRNVFQSVGKLLKLVGDFYRNGYHTIVLHKHVVELPFQYEHLKL